MRRRVWEAGSYVRKANHIESAEEAEIARLSKPDKQTAKQHPLCGRAPKRA